MDRRVKKRSQHACEARGALSSNIADHSDVIGTPGIGLHTEIPTTRVPTLHTSRHLMINTKSAYMYRQISGWSVKSMPTLDRNQDHPDVDGPNERRRLDD